MSDTPILPEPAPARRVDSQTVERQFQAVLSYHKSDTFLDAFSQPLLVLNETRQIVFCNLAFMELVGEYDRQQVRGKRPGDILGCTRAVGQSEDCGTSQHCRTCGALSAILESLDGQPCYHECLLNRFDGHQEESLEIGVTARPLLIDNEDYAVITLTNISGEKRRQSLERIFFHDILNTAGSLQGYTDILAEHLRELKLSSEDGVDPGRVVSTLQVIARQLIDEIREQQDLLLAENNQLEVQREPVSSLAILTVVVGQYLGQRIADKRTIKIDPESPDISFTSSSLLLRRVLGNMLKNALEASREGQTVRVGCRILEGEVEFWVHNESVISPEVQLQVFQRSFSTKGKERGLGTYSMKLITERYLGGTVTFDVCAKTGTTFRARYPCR
ncbi:ATP-binding protein [Desulfurispira natronophila]|uniref:histidine kinase n=1 Tax=Desulfurispira natronophila TaxID=682562 RepID=A0A7W8DG32_9BACT|nr:ATP-binding protein [Desulfurispira natronophila]MBB5021061.1 signal transduction histidine kinase [Desulfurispira natronophila]